MMVRRHTVHHGHAYLGRKAHGQGSICASGIKEERGGARRGWGLVVVGRRHQWGGGPLNMLATKSAGGHKHGISPGSCEQHKHAHIQGFKNPTHKKTGCTHIVSHTHTYTHTQTYTNIHTVLTPDGPGLADHAAPFLVGILALPWPTSCR